MFSAPARAGDCDPDVAGKDRITKQQVSEWQQVLTSTGILSAALMDNDVTFIASVSRVGDKNVIRVIVQKVEENLARAAFESQFRAARGDEIIFGFKNGGPVTFVTTKAGNAAAAGAFSGKLNMSAVWEADVTDADLAKYRASLTTQVIDAIRITAVSGQIDRSVPPKNGQRLMQKFGCFYRTVDYGSVAGGQTASPGGDSAFGGNTSSATPLEAAVRSTANCRANFTVGGSMVRGTSYATYDEFPGVPYAAALQATESAIAKASLTIESSEKTAGTITAVGETTKGGSGTFLFTVVPSSGGVRVSIEQRLHAGKHGSDDAVRDSMCKILSSMAESTAKTEAARPKVAMTEVPKPSVAEESASRVPEPAKKDSAAITPEERLRQLDGLYKKGLISEEEYKKKRAQILNSL
jgi:hypothetical protein